MSLWVGSVVWLYKENIHQTMRKKDEGGRFCATVIQENLSRILSMNELSGNLASNCEHSQWDRCSTETETANANVSMQLVSSAAAAYRQRALLMQMVSMVCRRR